MRAVVQRVLSSSVSVEGEVVGKIGKGLMVLLGVEAGDKQSDMDYICRKVAMLRIFEDEAGKMNQDVRQAGGAVLLVSQFILLGDARHGNRPGFIMAEEPEIAKDYFLRAAKVIEAMGIHVEQGIFMADQKVSLINDGPVTILLDSRRLF